MKYNILSQKEIQSPPSEDSDSEHFRPPQGRGSASLVTLLALSSTTLISVLLLLSLFTFRGSPQCAVQDNGWTVTRPYGRENSSRMSLAPEHDGLWSVFEPLPAFGGMSKENPDTAGMISMFHQMHCLASLRRALQMAQDGHDIGHGEKEGIHWPHCFDYLYQTLRCYADDTDEWEIFSRPRTKRISGMDTMRTCRDPSQLVQRACDAREYYISVGWVDGPMPAMCATGEMPW